MSGIYLLQFVRWEDVETHYPFCHCCDQIFVFFELCCLMVTCFHFHMTGVAVSTLRSSGKFTKTQNACNTQEGQICVDMNVLARSRSTGWQMGTIVEIVTKGNKTNVFRNTAHNIIQYHKITSVGKCAFGPKKSCQC